MVKNVNHTPRADANYCSYLKENGALLEPDAENNEEPLVEPGSVTLANYL